jgi:hypothetical protein
MPREEARAFIEELLGEERQALARRARASGSLLSDYATTLIGVMAGAEGGWFFHVGDGLGLAQPRAAEAWATVSPPENGEYVNETYFVTGESWRERLRLTAIGAPLSTVVLMSDGAMSFVMNRARDALFAPFYDPVARYLEGATLEEGNRALTATLEDARTHAITSDDKTLLIAQWCPQAHGASRARSVAP